MKSIKIQIRSVYGRDTIYPACETSKMFAALAGTKTLTEDAMRIIKAAGYQITVIAPAYA